MKRNVLNAEELRGWQILRGGLELALKYDVEAGSD
jgi:hypothetical protein